MTNKHDGPRPGTPVTVIQAATPTRHTRAEAEELDRLIRAVLETRWQLGLAQATHQFDTAKCKDAEAADREAFTALYAWQRRHGLESK